MRLAIAVLLAFWATASAAVEDPDEDNALHELNTAYDAQRWEAVGRLNIGWGGMCTAALIGPKLVLTAAHCTFDSQSRRIMEPSELVFNAGWRNGRAAASRRVKRIVVHPSYSYEGSEGAFDVSHDLALLELESEIQLATILPFPTGDKPRKGDSVGVVSYAHDRASSPSIQKSCHVLARQRSALVLSCDVDFGSSGAPIFADIEGRPTIVSVVSAKGEIQGRRVSFGTDLTEPLADMMALLRNGGGQLAAPSVNIVKPDTTRRLTGGDSAKFVRP